MSGFVYYTWSLFVVISGFCLYRMFRAFAPLKAGRGWHLLLFVLLGGTTGMVIWVGDNNLLFTLPVFVGVCMLCTTGDRLGRLSVTVIFFCLIMSCSALLDTYLKNVSEYDAVVRILRPVIWGVLYLLMRKNLPEEPIRLPRRLWKLVAGLAAMPMCSLAAVVLLTSSRYYSQMVYTVSMNLGIAVLPFVFLTSLVLLFAMKILAEHAELEQARQLGEMREVYYQGLRREQEQVRGLRHDMRNHLTALQGYLEQGDMGKALGYLQQIAGSPAMRGTIHYCANETANAVLSAKALTMEQLRLKPDFTVSLPENLPISDPDLCVLLGSALDNALEAACETEDRTVTLRVSGEKGLFMLRCVNGYVGERTMKDGVYQTTKGNKKSHGFGLKTMAEIAKRMGGTLETTAEAGRFELIICIPIKTE